MILVDGMPFKKWSIILPIQMKWNLRSRVLVFLNSYINIEEKLMELLWFTDWAEWLGDNYT